ncbi:response regulator [Pseudonocardia humida]|uniref:Response regulator transcription factor n=1 Tax=Pseudonocardia humida TaxID=2800819 RepID=A0ABT1A5M6_9PSEU|nr:response regulator transcription factor [Pseudonocardia humida]MCO1658280.1 response regulator transcription factor [Pseudonocardia humida]
MRVTIAEDSALLREGLVRLLVAEGHEVVAAVGDGRALVGAIERERPDVVVADVRMPPTHTDEGVVAALEIRRRWPEVGVLVLSQYVERRHAARLLADDGGRVGYLLKDRVAQVGEFLDALERVGRGGSAFDPEVVRRLLATGRDADPLSRLTPRERDVLDAVAEGLTNASAAGRLRMSVSAVEKHVASILGKLGVAEDPGYNRRILAVLRYLGGRP